MAGGMDKAEAKRLLDASNGVTAYTAPTTPINLALYTVIGTDNATGTEVTGGSYARQGLGPVAATAGASGATSDNASIVAYTNMPAVTTVAVETFDSAGTPRRQMWGALAANKTTNLGDTLSFAATTGITQSLG